MKAEYRDVIPLVANPKGWDHRNVSINHDSDPSFSSEMQDVLDLARQRTEVVRKGFGDFNAPKAAVRRLSAEAGGLVVDTYATEYFVLWGLPGAVPDLHNQALNDLYQKKATEIPMGISTHNIVLITPDGTKSADKTYAAMIINDPRHGFAPGRLSVSYEGQMDPTQDIDPNGIPSTFSTVLRTMREEFGIGLDQSRIKIGLDDIRLVAVCVEKGSAYTSWCHVVWVQANQEEFIASYNLAPRRKSADALLMVPLSRVDVFTQDEIRPEDYRPFVIASSLEGETTLKPHPTVLWRADALKDYLTSVV